MENAESENRPLNWPTDRLPLNLPAGKKKTYSHQQIKITENVKKKLIEQKEITRAISIRQPYVEQILRGEKTIEYRTRKTNIRERVYLYASLTKETDEDLPTGLIVGSVEIVDCTGYEGNYEWHLASPKRLKKYLKPTNQPQPCFWRPQFNQEKVP